jgi:hypothetical protein
MVQMRSQFRMRTIYTLYLLFQSLAILAIRGVVVDNEADFFIALSQNATIDLNTDIVLTKTINIRYVDSTINVDGHSHSIDGVNMFTCFNITSSSSVMLKNLSIKNGIGGVIVHSSTVHIVNSSIFNNSAVS